MSTPKCKLTSEELSDSPENVLKIVQPIGTGSYGSVYKAVHIKTSQVLAVKKILLMKDIKNILKEVEYLRNCDSEYVTKYYGSFLSDGYLWIVMEYCMGGSISSIIALRQESMTELETASILADTLKGIQFVHRQRLIHRDIKAGNILLTREGIAKLADFGVASRISEFMSRRNTVIGTPYWMAPEIMNGMGYGYSADIWSLGITTIEMLDGNPPHSEIHPMRVTMIIANEKPPTFVKPRSLEATDFLASCLVKDPEARGDIRKLLTHRFLEQNNRQVLIDLIQKCEQHLEKVVDIPEGSDEFLEELTQDDADTLVLVEDEVSRRISIASMYFQDLEFTDLMDAEIEDVNEESLSELDDKMAKEIQRIKKLFEEKRSPIRQAILMKKDATKSVII